MSAEERREESNGIWLCCFCATLIDADADKYSPEHLRQLKEQAEREQEHLVAGTWGGLGLFSLACEWDADIHPDIPPKKRGYRLLLTNNGSANCSSIRARLARSPASFSHVIFGHMTPGGGGLKNPSRDSRFQAVVELEILRPDETACLARLVQIGRPTPAHAELDTFMLRVEVFASDMPSVCFTATIPHWPWSQAPPKCEWRIAASVD